MNTEDNQFIIDIVIPAICNVPVNINGIKKCIELNIFTTDQLTEYMRSILSDERLKDSRTYYRPIDTSLAIMIMDMISDLLSNEDIISFCEYISYHSLNAECEQQVQNIMYKLPHDLLSDNMIIKYGTIEDITFLIDNIPPSEFMDKMRELWPIIRDDPSKRDIVKNYLENNLGELLGNPVESLYEMIHIDISDIFTNDLYERLSDPEFSPVIHDCIIKDARNKFSFAPNKFLDIFIDKYGPLNIDDRLSLDIYINMKMYDGYNTLSNYTLSNYRHFLSEKVKAIFSDGTSLSDLTNSISGLDKMVYGSDEWYDTVLAHFD